ncbi:MAG: hypothetical protein U0797_29215 [Gemmataceae bacterium]
MKVTFDDQAWQRLQDDLSVGQLCAETAGRLYAYAKAAMQQASAALVGQAEASPEDAAHTLAMLRALRNNAQDAARRFAASVTAISLLERQLKPPSVRPRRRNTA